MILCDAKGGRGKEEKEGVGEETEQVLLLALPLALPAMIGLGEAIGLLSPKRALFFLKLGNE